MIQTFLALAAVAAVAGCGGANPWDENGHDQDSYRACQRVADRISGSGGADMTHALPAAQRGDFVEAVQRGGNSDAPGMAEAATNLVAASDGSRVAWTVAMNEFSRVCLDLNEPASGS